MWQDLRGDGSNVAEARDAVTKSLELVCALEGSPRGRVASDLARECELPLSTAHRLLRILVKSGFVEFEPESRRYTLGLTLYRLALASARGRGLQGSVRPVLEELSSVTREASLLSIRQDDHMVYVESVEGPQQVRFVGRAGTFGPLHCTSQGKVLIAFSDDITRQYLVQNLDLLHYTPKTITSRPAFAEAIERVRQSGYAVIDEEHEQGVRAISVPVYEPATKTLAALSVAAPAYRMTVAQLEEYLPVTYQAAEKLRTILALTGTPN
jgi:DNA-binding IclR family transcriptional regulator